MNVSSWKRVKLFSSEFHQNDLFWERKVWRSDTTSPIELQIRSDCCTWMIFHIPNIDTSKICPYIFAKLSHSISLESIINFMTDYLHKFKFLSYFQTPFERWWAPAFPISFWYKYITDNTKIKILKCPPVSSGDIFAPLIPNFIPALMK